MRYMFVFWLVVIACAPVVAQHQIQPKLSRIAVDEFGGGDATISPDGSRFLTTSRRSGNWDVWMYDIPRGLWTQITHDTADDFEGRFSPDGKSIVFCSTRAGQKDVWVLNVKTNESKQLTSSEYDDEYPVWSPDSKYICYTSGPWKKRHIYQILASGGEPQQLTKLPSFLGACSFAPDGESLVCHRYDAGNGDLFRLSRKGGKTTTLTSGRAWDYKPVPSPDNSWIAFSRAVEGPSHIWLTSKDGSISTQITKTPHQDRWPTWSKSGQELLFHRIVERGQGIKALDLESGTVNELVPATESPLYASFDPSGTRLVYSCQDGPNKRLRILDISTGQFRSLETGNNDVNFPKWSPDGNSIAYVMRGANRWEICMTNVDGTRQTNLTETAKDLGLRGMDGSLDWSPDSSRIVFHADTEAFAANLFSVDVASKHITRLTDGSFFDESPAWSPDGRRVVFMSTRGGNWTWCFYELDIQQKSLKKLTTPNWVEKNSPRILQSGQLVFSTVDEKGQHVLAQLTPTGKRQIFHEAGTGVRWPSFSSDQKKVLFSRVSQHVEYWLATDLLDLKPLQRKTFEPRISHRPIQQYPFKPISPGTNVGTRSPVGLYHR